MRLDTESLRAFIAALDHHGMTNAADELGISQSAVSWRIRRLEERVGKSRVSWREGIRRMIEARNPELLARP